MVDLEMFLTGLKPALYENSKGKAFMSIIHRFMDFPHVLINGYYLFFQSEKLQDEFMTRVDGLEFD